MATRVLSGTAFLWYRLCHCWLSSVWGLHTSTEAPIAELPGESNRSLVVLFHSLRFRLTSNLQIGAFLILMLGDVLLVSSGGKCPIPVCIFILHSFYLLNFNTTFYFLLLMLAISINKWITEKFYLKTLWFLSEFEMFTFNKIFRVWKYLVS